MTATNHVITGAVIALAVKNPWLALPAALVSHFIADIIPHFAPLDYPEKTSKIITATDTLLSIAVGLVIVLTATAVPTWIIFACMLAAVSPDLIWLLRFYRLGGSMERLVAEPMSSFSRYHLRIQTELRPGIFIELAWLVLMAILLIRLS